jgi:vinculin
MDCEVLPVHHADNDLCSRIIASVKAASASQNGNAEADNMLVKNAQNLMETVMRTVRAAEAASMKSFSSAAATATAGIRWKRKTKSMRVK